ncbi:pyridoxamine 5'-phosphate oxidase family protein [Sphaerisporangium perillae]|uniref:pyridoxamine 5'-phosphate oxidase family protein n=1 Tax=Sphaerisporangium perillae TaxID=2935860 RepID=UPI002010280F|nr:pyridoxamine 5'-phosphate oxidase family protein [Sphaerisporangium perillae]
MISWKGDAVAENAGYQEITSAAELRELLGEVRPRAVTKERVMLHERDREWLAASPFCLIATAGADGDCDVSPKGDPPGFTRVLDATSIAIPDRPGNRRADGFLNVLANPHVGLVYLVPGRNETLRINGRARLVREAPFFDEMIVKGHRPALAMVVEIEQIFFHCGKAFMRSALWKPESWNPDVLPSHAQIVKSVQQTQETIEELEQYYGAQYETRLYRA